MLCNSLNFSAFIIRLRTSIWADMMHWEMWFSKRADRVLQIDVQIDRRQKQVHNVQAHNMPFLGLQLLQCCFQFRTANSTGSRFSSRGGTLGPVPSSGRYLSRKARH